VIKANATSRKVEGSTLDKVNEFFNIPNPSSRTMALGLSQSKARPARKADNLAAICEPIV
jgi:hypothetical protein